MSYLFRPEIGPDTLTARYYQQGAIDAVQREFRRGIRRTLVVHPTGTGKSCVIAKIIRMTVDNGKRALAIAHRDELIADLANDIERCGVVPGIEKAGAFCRSIFNPHSVVASVQSLQGERLRSFPSDYFSLLIFDEAHHVPSPSWTKIMAHFSKARVLGLTATPVRSSGEQLDEVFESIAHEFTIHEAMTAGPPGPYMSKFRFIREDVGVRLGSLKARQVDYNDEDLRIRISPAVERFSQKIREHLFNRQTLVYTPTVDVATAFASALGPDNLGLNAEWVSGDDPHRAYKVARYREGSIQILCSCDLFSEGFNDVNTSGIALCRPTKSWVRYVQMIGRGLRPKNEMCYILDFDWITDKHSLCRPSDLFAREIGVDGIAFADHMTGVGCDVDILDVVERARKKGREVAKERDVIEVRARPREVVSRRTEVLDPYGDDYGCLPQGSSRSFYHEMATPKMVAFLKWHGHQSADKYSKRYAGKLIGIIKETERSERGIIDESQNTGKF